MIWTPRWSRSTLEQEILMQNAKSLPPVQEEAQYANTAFWNPDSSKTLPKNGSVFSECYSLAHEHLLRNYQVE